MSAIVVVKEGSTVIVGTDSRFVSADRTRIVTDAAEKIQEIARGNIHCDFWLFAGLRFSEREGQRVGPIHTRHSSALRDAC